MKVSELIAELECFDEDAEVHFSYVAGDYWRTQLAPKIRSVSKYHSFFATSHLIGWSFFISSFLSKGISRYSFILTYIQEKKYSVGTYINVSLIILFIIWSCNLLCNVSAYD